MTYSENLKLFFPNGAYGYSYEQILASMDLVPSTYKYNELTKNYEWIKCSKSWKQMTYEEARNLLDYNESINKKLFIQQKRLDKIKEDF